MNFRPLLSAPMPWLALILGTLGARLGLRTASKGLDSHSGKYLGTDNERTRLKIRRYFLPRTLKFTRMGKVFIVILLLVGIAAINTGNNLLYLVVSMMLSLIVISGILSETSIKKIDARREIKEYTYKDSPLRVKINVKNDKSRLPSFSFTVDEHPAKDLVTRAAYILKLEAGAELAAPASYTFSRRGLFRLSALELRTRFPFGLFIKGRTIFTDDQIIVFPRIRPVSQLSGDEQSTSGETSRSRRGLGSQLHSLRTYTSSDDARFIHWKSAAKTGELFRKEFETETEQKVVIIFNNVSGGDTETFLSAFEEEVEKAASLVNHYIKKNFSVSLRTRSRVIDFASGDKHLKRLLTELALVKAEGSGTPTVSVERP